MILGISDERFRQLVKEYVKKHPIPFVKDDYKIKLKEKRRSTMKVNDRVLVHFSDGSIKEGVIVAIHSKTDYCYEVNCKITSDYQRPTYIMVHCRKNDLELVQNTR